MKTKNIKDKIKQYFLVNPSSKLRVRHIEKQLKIPLPSAIRYTKELESEKILKRIKTENVTFYSGDRNSSEFIIEKKLFNIKQLYTSGLINHLTEQFSNPIIIVFGSYSKGEDIESSDVDLYIETPMSRKIDLSKYEQILKRKIQMFIHKNLESVKSKELMNSIINGIVLNGFIEVF